MNAPADAKTIMSTTGRHSSRAQRHGQKGRWWVGEAGRLPARAVLAGCCGIDGVSFKAELDWGCVDGASGMDCCARRLQWRMRSFLPAARSMRRRWARALRVTLLGPGRLVTQRWIAWHETEVGEVKREATVCLNPQGVRALGHDE